MKKTLVSLGIGLAATLAFTGTASAHDCFNPTKKVGAGSRGVVTVTATGDTFVPSDKPGNGGFVTIDATALVPGVVIDVHTFGNGGPKDGVVGPGAEKAGAKGCDGKGLDYVETCFGAE